MDNLIFVTNSNRHNVSYPTLPSWQAQIYIENQLDKVDRVQLDFETTGLDPYINKLLLTAINIGGNIYIIDNTSIKLSDIMTTEDLHDKLVISHNGKFEYKFCKTNGVQLNRMYCTMVAEQRLIMGTGLSSNLVDTCIRRGVDLPEGMDKDVRNIFIGANPDEIVFTDKEILYAAGDVIPLEDIMNVQQTYIDKYNMNHVIHNIEMPLINILGDNELDGFRHNSERWINYAKKKEAEAIELSKQLDEQAKQYGVKLEEINPEIIKRNNSRENKLAKLVDRAEKLSDKLNDLYTKGKTHLKVYQITKDTYEKVKNDYSTLFSQTTDEYVGINWSSSDQVLKVFNNIKDFSIPKSKNATTKSIEPSIGKEARSLWLADNEGNQYYEFFKLFDKYKKIIHNVNAFGEKWVENYVNPITGKVHTHYFQCSTDTGRLASGDAKNGWLNIQQIPSIKELRSCFIADEGYEIVTTDYAGAELRIMCSLADDQDLWSLNLTGDIHSPIATKAWRAVYASRGNIELATTYEVTKEDKDGARRKFKNLTFKN